MASAAGFAPLNWWLLSLICLAGLIALIERAKTLRRALATGWLFGLGHFVIGLNWIATAFYYQDAMPHWLGWIAVVLVSLFFAIYPAVATGLAWRWGRRSSLVSLCLALAIAWIVTEWLRATLFTGFAWNPLGVMLVDIGKPARWIGTYGLSAIVILTAGAIAGLGVRKWREAAWLALPLATCAIISWAIPPAPPPRPDSIWLHVVQPDINQNEKWDEALAARNYKRLAGLTGKPTAHARLILWPEAAIPDYLDEEPWARERLAGLLGPHDLLLTGGNDLVYDKAGKLVAAHNSLFAVDSQARVLARYDKAHLVPYGEYLPMRPILSALGLSRLAPGDFDFLAGPGPRTLIVPGFGKIGIQICYEMIFSGQVVDKHNRPDFIFNPSNDAWFGGWGPPQHLAQARLRAIEEGLPIVRSTPTGISAVVDADGRIIDQLAWHQPGAIDAKLPGALPPTLFSRFGNVLPFLFAALLALILIAVRRGAR